MNIRISDKVYVALVILGALTQLVTSTISRKYIGVPLNSYESIEEYLWFNGQAAGELCYLVSIVHWVSKYKVPYLFFVFMVDLSIIDCADIIDYKHNPFIHHWSKTISIIIAILYSVYKLYRLFKKKV